jgi:hypothetical protein
MPREPIFRERTSGLREPGREGEGEKGRRETKKNTKYEERSTKYEISAL